MKAEFNPIIRGKKRPTYLNCIKAMCAHCVGCTETHLERGFKESIRACAASKCPLYHHRPYQRYEDPKPSEAAADV